MDWNQDGNRDWQDDAFFHTMTDSQGGSSGGESSGNGLGWVVILAILAIVSFFL